MTSTVRSKFFYKLYYKIWSNRDKVFCWFIQSKISSKKFYEIADLFGTAEIFFWLKSAHSVQLPFPLLSSNLWSRASNQPREVPRVSRLALPRLAELASLAIRMLNTLSPGSANCCNAHLVVPWKNSVYINLSTSIYQGLPCYCSQSTLIVLFQQFSAISSPHESQLQVSHDLEEVKLFDVVAVGSFLPGQPF